MSTSCPSKEALMKRILHQLTTVILIVGFFAAPAFAQRGPTLEDYQRRLERWRAFSPVDRQRLINRWREYQGLPGDERLEFSRRPSGASNLVVFEARRVGKQRSQRDLGPVIGLNLEVEVAVYVHFELEVASFDLLHRSQGSQWFRHRPNPEDRLR